MAAAAPPWHDQRAHELRAHLGRGGQARRCLPLGRVREQEERLEQGGVLLWALAGLERPPALLQLCDDKAADALQLRC